MWREAIEHVVGCWTNERYSFEGKHWSLPIGACSRSRCSNRTRRSGARRRATTATRQVGELGLGLCSFAVGVSPEDVKKKIDIYRDAVAKCTTPIGKFVNNQAATFTMALCAPTEDEAWDAARESFEWYPKVGRAPDRAGRGVDGGAQAGARQLRLRRRHEGALRRRLARPAVARVPRRLGCVRARHARAVPRRVQALRGRRRRPAALPREPVQDRRTSQVMQTIDLMGKHVIPSFS